MQEFQKLITPGHVTGHRAKAVMRPLYAPACVSYAAGAILAVCAISGAGGHAVRMPTWLDHALTADQAAYQKAADDRAQARERAAQEAAQAALAAQQTQQATTDAADQASQPAPQVVPAPSSAVSPALTTALNAVMNLPTPKKSVDAVMNSRQIDMILNPLIRNDPPVADAVNAGMTACVKTGERMGNEALAAAPNRVIPPARMVEILDYRRTCARDLLTKIAKGGQ